MDSRPRDLGQRTKRKSLGTGGNARRAAPPNQGNVWFSPSARGHLYARSASRLASPTNVPPGRGALGSFCATNTDRGERRHLEKRSRSRRTHFRLAGILILRSDLSSSPDSLDLKRSGIWSPDKDIQHANLLCLLLPCTVLKRARRRTRKEAKIWTAYLGCSLGRTLGQHSNAKETGSVQCGPVIDTHERLAAQSAHPLTHETRRRNRLIFFGERQ